ncbi:MAG TPA: hypothetical protein VK813_11210, partial [Edaphobacter sp.]|nr:hypothetical protein [Edaphobacter sp.]
MSVGETFGDLGLGLKRLQDVVDALHMTIAEDRPAGGGSMVVDAIESETLDLLGLIQEARDGVSDAEKGLRSAPDLDATRRALVLCQKRVQT